MLIYAIRRIVLLFPLILAVATVTFFLMHSVEGGPFDSDRPLSDAQRETMEGAYGLDKPLYQQYTTYLGNLVQGDLGVSFNGGSEVRKVIIDRAPVSVQLGLTAFLFAIVFGLSLGILSSLNQNGPLDYVGVFLATGGAALPAFVIAPLLQIIFGLRLNWFDVIGWEMWNPSKMVLPVIALGFLPMAFIARITRASMVEVLRQDYIRTARAKGLKETGVIARHATKNAMIPILTILGPIFAGLITGSFIVERAFVIPGIGQQFVNSVLTRDYGMIMGMTLLFAVIIALMNLFVDLMYGFVDPRIRY